MEPDKEIKETTSEPSQETQGATQTNDTPQVDNEVAKYTDKQLNDLILKNSSKASEKAKAELMASLGIKDVSEIEALKEARKAQMSDARKAQMSDAEKATLALKEQEAATQSARREADEAIAEVAAMKAGVPVDKVERVRKLAMSGQYEGDTPAEKINAVLADFPEFIKQTSVNLGAPTGKNTVSDEESILQKLREQRRGR